MQEQNTSEKSATKLEACILAVPLEGWSAVAARLRAAASSSVSRVDGLRSYEGQAVDQEPTPDFEKVQVKRVYRCDARALCGRATPLSRAAAGRQPSFFWAGRAAARLLLTRSPALSSLIVTTQPWPAGCEQEYYLRTRPRLHFRAAASWPSRDRVFFHLVDVSTKHWMAIRTSIQNGRRSILAWARKSKRGLALLPRGP